MHTTAFIITSVRLGDRDADPTDEQLRQAAREAIVTAKQAQTSPDGTDYESFSLGCRQFRFIQGEHRTNSQLFAPAPTNQWPETTHQVMSQIHEPDLSDEGIDAIPMDVLRNSWNTAHRLVGLALENSGARREHPDQRTIIYPQILLSPDGIVGQCITFPGENVFGETDQDLVNRRAVKAMDYTNAREPGGAYFLAQYPLRRLAQAQFECDYIRAMAEYDDHIVLEADWNM